MDIRLLLHPNSPGFWVLVSLLAWLAIRLTTRYWSPRQLLWITVARWVLIPYAGLIAGSLSPQLMGLIDIDWQTTLGIGIVLTAILIGLMAVVRFMLNDISAAEPSPTDTSPSETEAETVRAPGWLWGGMTIITTGAEQFQWSFLRGAVLEIALLNLTDIGQAGYWSIWIATLLALPAILLQPLNRTDRLLKVTVLIISAILFVFTQNFWLCWTFHASDWLLLATDRPSHTITGP